MCGIAGFSGSFDAELLGRMAASIGHRGPDDEGVSYLSEARVGLAHRRLSIIDLSEAGHQPMWSPDDMAAITYNGEIYNYRELRKELVADGVSFRGHSDTEVLLQLYLRDGDALLTRLNGIYGFAIWDARDRSLFLARDPLGVKPLYYAETPNGFLFASELKALLQWPGLDRSLDLRALHYHLHFQWSPSPHTMLKSVRKLEPGCALRVREGRIERSWRFWDIPYERPIEDLSDGQAIEALREAISTAVRRQMVADVPVGSFLSGGLDSSAVVAFGQDAVPERRMRCFTIGFTDPAAQKEGMAEDLPYAQQVARHLGVDLETVWVGPEMADEVPAMLYHLEEPQPDPSAVNAMLICRLARQHDMKVLLSGMGGDDVLSGYRRHTAYAQERYWSWLPGGARRGLAGLARRLPVGSQWSRRISKAFQYADRDGDGRLASYFYWIAPGMLDRLYSGDVRTELDGVSADGPIEEALARLPAGTPALNRMLYLEGKFYLADHNLNYVDKVAMASGVEVRVPLLDLDVVSLAASLRPDLKQRGTTGKWVFRKAMEGILPNNVIYRPKVGFGVPLRNWIRGPLQPMVEELLSERSLHSRGLFDPAGVRRLIELDRAGRVDAAYPIFGLICTELWCRTFVDPATPAVWTA